MTSNPDTDKTSARLRTYLYVHGPHSRDLTELLEEAIVELEQTEATLAAARLALEAAAPLVRSVQRVEPDGSPPPGGWDVSAPGAATVDQRWAATTRELVAARASQRVILLYAAGDTWSAMFYRGADPMRGDASAHGSKTESAALRSLAELLEWADDRRGLSLHAATPVDARRWIACPHSTIRGYNCDECGIRVCAPTDQEMADPYTRNPVILLARKAVDAWWVEEDGTADRRALERQVAIVVDHARRLGTT